MKLLLHLSGEHPELPRAEVIGVLEGEKIKYKISEEFMHKRLLIIDVDTDNTEFLNRLALTKSAGELIYISNNMDELASILSERIDGTFAIRSESKRTEEILGRLIWKRGYKVDLITPGSRILCFEDNGKYLVAIDTPLHKDFGDRSPEKRPFFHPTAMKPKIARLMVNLARVRKNCTILDPFCGTGSILIEAGVMKINIMGLDISEKIVSGCIENLKFYGLKGNIEVGDALKMKNFINGVDAIVTDPPYGRSSIVTENNLEEFYNKFLDSAADVLRKGKCLVLSIPDKFSLENEEFELLSSYKLYVHKSLTRRILVFKKN